MKKILLIFSLCLVFFGCGTERQSIEDFKKEVAKNNRGTETLSGAISKDENDLYFSDKIIDSTGVDLPSLIYLKYEYLRDKNNVYYFNNYEHKLEKLDVNLETFKVLSSDYAKDENNVFVITFNEEHSPQIISDADPETFEATDGNYAKDKNKVYLNFLGGLIKIESADPASFENLNMGYFAKDKNYVYRTGKIMEGLDPESFQVFNNYYFRDKNNCYNNVGKIVDMSKCKKIDK